MYLKNIAEVFKIGGKNINESVHLLLDLTGLYGLCRQKVLPSSGGKRDSIILPLQTTSGM